MNLFVRDKYVGTKCEIHQLGCSGAGGWQNSVLKLSKPPSTRFKKLEFRLEFSRRFVLQRLRGGRVGVRGTS